MRIKYLSPGTNCQYLARKMWVFYQKGGIHRVLSHLYYFKIARRYGCCIFRSAKVGKGFRIEHPDGIVIGECRIGENFSIHQNCTIVTRNNSIVGPQIGNNVTQYARSAVLGDIVICDDVKIGANSVVINSLEKGDIYSGSVVKTKI